MTHSELPPESVAALSSLGRLTYAREEIENTMEEEVENAREHGASWRMIGVALGTSGQAAWQRYSGHERDSEIQVEETLPGFSSD